MKAQEQELKDKEKQIKANEEELKTQGQEIEALKKMAEDLKQRDNKTLQDTVAVLSANGVSQEIINSIKNLHQRPDF